VEEEAEGGEIGERELFDGAGELNLEMEESLSKTYGHFENQDNNKEMARTHENMGICKEISMYASKIRQMRQSDG